MNRKPAGGHQYIHREFLNRPPGNRCWSCGDILQSRVFKSKMYWRWNTGKREFLGYTHDYDCLNREPPASEGRASR